MPPFVLNDVDTIMNSSILIPLRLTKKQVCKLLNVSINQLRKISLADLDFPKPIKSGLSRQSGVYYDYEEIQSWHRNQLKNR